MSNSIPFAAELAAELAAEVTINGGVTYDVTKRIAMTCRHGYAVALYGAERAVEFGSDLVAEIADYLTRYGDWSGTLFGAWSDNGTVYLDRTIIVDDLDDALDIARQNRQRAIYDMSRLETIYLDR